MKNVARKFLSAIGRAPKVLAGRQLSRRKMRLAGEFHRDFKDDPVLTGKAVGNELIKRADGTITWDSTHYGPSRDSLSDWAGAGNSAPKRKIVNRIFTADGKLVKKRVIKPGKNIGETERVTETEYSPPGRFKGKRQKHGQR